MQKRALISRPVSVNLTTDSFGGLAIVAIHLDNVRPMALRHRLSPDLPLSGMSISYIFLIFPSMVFTFSLVRF